MRGHRDPIPFRSAARLAFAVPTLSGAVAFLVALIVGASLDEALLAGAICAAGPALGTAAVVARHRSPGHHAACLSAAGLAALLVAACYGYGRVSGYATGDIRAGLGVVLAALAMAAAAHAAIGLGKGRRLPG